MQNRVPLPKLTDIYKLRVTNNNTSLSKAKCIKNNKPCVYYVTYADIVDAITQRFYDYDFYFNNLVATSNNTSSSDYADALAGLTDLLSPNLTSFQIQTNGATVFSTTNRTDAIGFFKFVAADIFQGYSAHNTTNIRVRPIFDSSSCQASTQSQLIQFANLIHGTPPAPGFVVDAGTYNMTWAYENGVWRIKTYIYNDRLSYNVETPYLTPTPYTPNPNVSNSC